MAKLLKLFLILIGLLLLPSQVYANDGLEFDSAITLGGAGYDSAKVKFDSQGNKYIYGYFSQTVDFDPGTSVDNKTSNGGYDIFLSKYDSSGNYLWTKTWGGSGNFDDTYNLIIDSNDNLYIGGEFQLTVDFDPGTNVDNKTSAGSVDAFLTKYDSSGNYLWTKTWGGTSHDRPEVLVFDSNGYVYVYGRYSLTVDFDPTEATNSQTSNGSYDIFLSKFDSSGNYLWTKTWGGGSNDYSDDLYFDTNNNLYLVGSFSLTVDFDWSSGVDNKTSNGTYDTFFSKYDSNGNYLWTKTWGGSDQDRPMDIIMSSDGYLYIAGFFGQSVDFDPSSGTTSKTSSGYLDNFISKFDTDGNFYWIKNIGGTGDDQAYGLTQDNESNYYYYGTFNDSLDFNPGNESDIKTSLGSYDGFISKFDSNWNYLWTRRVGGSQMDMTLNTVIYSGYLYTTGIFQDSVYLNSDNNTNQITSNGSVDFFLTKYEIDNTKPSFSIISIPSGGQNTKPNLSIKKGSDTNGISSYSVYLDRGKGKSYAITNIPNSGNGSSSFLWKDDSDYRVEFINENDSSIDNDQINVYFKGLDTNPLTEGLHNWTGEAIDNELNSTEISNPFIVDLTSPSIKDLYIPSVGFIKEGNTYKLPRLLKNPIITGKFIDPLKGSTVTYSNGISDTFDKDCVGPKEINIQVMKMVRQNIYKEYSNQTTTFIPDNFYTNQDEKYVDFSIKLSTPLTNGFYKLIIKVTDYSNNTKTLNPIYMSLNYLYKTSILGEQTSDETVELVQITTTPTPQVSVPITNTNNKVENNTNTVEAKNIFEKIVDIIKSIF